MMKKFIVASLMFAGVAAAASAQTTTTAPCGNQECTNATCQGNHQACTAGRPQNCPNPFEGLDLTAEQQTALQALAPQNRNADRAAQREARRENVQNSRTEYLAQVKNILTHEQYITFLENSFVKAGQGNMRPQNRAGMRQEQRVNRNANTNLRAAQPASQTTQAQ